MRIGFADAGKPLVFARFRNLRSVLIAAALGIGLVSLPILAAALIVSNHQEDLQRRSELEVENLLKLIADGMRQPVWDLNPDAGEAIIGAIEADRRFISVTVKSLAQGDFLCYARPEMPGSDVAERAVKILHDGATIGEVRARIDRGQLLATADSGWPRIVALIGMQLVFSIGAVALLIWLATRETRSRTRNPRKIPDQPHGHARADLAGSGFRATRRRLPRFHRSGRAALA